jgi:hypothetical protein
MTEVRQDTTYQGTASETTLLARFLSSWNITETAGSTAYVKFRDSLPLLAAPSAAVDGAAGNVTAGLHMIAVTLVTRNGESLLGPLLEFTAAGSKHATVTIPVGRGLNETAGASGAKDVIVGRRVYVTKAGAPATTVTPTNAQWFRVTADLATTVAAGMNNLPLAGNASITVASTAGFAASGIALVTTTTGVQPVAYTSVDATHFLGCTLLRGLNPWANGYLATGNAVTQPMVGDNTSTTFDWNVVDGSLTATNPPSAIDTAGRRIETVKLSAATSVGELYGSVRALENGGGLHVEVNSGTVEWTVGGL